MTKMTVTKMRELLKLYFITGSVNCKKNPDEVLEEAIRGGITLFQFREKGTGSLTRASREELAVKLMGICRRHRIPFIVNDDVDLAIRLGADGVHIGQDDERASEVRKKIGDKILGVSAHTLEEARLAIEAGANYLGVGPIFLTATKDDAKKPIGPGLVRELREKGYDIPIVGIGGITSANAAEVIAAGADGVSVISAISQAHEPALAASELLVGVSRVESKNQV
ncbi:thiamine phosphate synthase [Neobacillus notoginsengisoli]|uniref:Thiamine-phosphate synthase n=1 Tax=Neobacillus notoginsengisoli TaxID=1578198 RepID=A0A417YY84_9BACI|nr:thiamine phosphate synthase [Neobacillus notoginsengisoli]RHW42706.1 thiamine phosphate synthase [Neobacillus notoginsengisoli]